MKDNCYSGPQHIKLNSDGFLFSLFYTRFPNQKCVVWYAVDCTSTPWWTQKFFIVRYAYASSGKRHLIGRKAGHGLDSNSFYNCSRLLRFQIPYYSFVEWSHLLKARNLQTPISSQQRKVSHNLKINVLVFCVIVYHCRVGI